MKRIDALIRLIMVALTLLAATIGHIADADDAQVHFAAHFGSAYAINMLTYGFMNYAITLQPTDSMMFAGFTTEMLGLTYKMEERGSRGPDVLRAVEINTLGIAASDLTIRMFHFGLEYVDADASIAARGIVVRIPFQ